MQAPQVETVQVLPQNVPLAFEFAARAQGSKETEVRARVGGILLKRNYVEGAEVKEGSVLFQIDPKPYEVALKQAQAKLAQIQAELKNAETQLARTEKLFKQGYASEKTRDEAVANADSLKASLQLAEAEVDAAQLNLDYTTVTAPISGKTSMEAQSEGSLISTTGDAGLLTHITQLDPIYVIFSVSENELMALTNMVESGKILNPYNSKDIVAKLKLGDDSLYEEDGKYYMLWGSFRNIYIMELNVTDNLDITPKVETKQQLAGNAYEAVNLWKHNGYYYLFASVGSCCEGEKSTYTTVVARSENLFGPYVNKKGEKILDNAHETVLHKNSRFVGTGHNAILQLDDEGNTWMLYHAFELSNLGAQRQVLLDQILWDEDGWPYVNKQEPSESACPPVIK